MKSTLLIQLAGAASCLTFASCALWPYENSEEAAKRDGSGYSLDNPASGSRYMGGADNAPPTETAADPSAVTGPATSSPSVPGGTPTTDTSAPPPSTVGSSPGPTPGPTPPPPTAAAAAPTYGTPVPGRRGFVYPPGVDPKPENMVDVRDFQPGQKVRDPRTGKIFLVP